MRTTIGTTVAALNWSALNRVPDCPLERHWLTVQAATFAKALYLYMREMEYTQQDVSERTGIAQPVVSRLLKTAEPSMVTLAKMAKGLSVDISVSANGAVKIHNRKIQKAIS